MPSLPIPIPIPLPSFLKNHPLPTTILITILSLPLPLLLRTAYNDYNNWHALGPGGIPHNVFGYLLQCGLQLFATRERDRKSTACYIGAGGELDRRSFFLEEEGVPVREGGRPEVAGWVLPHRQIGGGREGAGEGVKEAIEAALSHISRSNPSLLETGPSLIELSSPALFVSANAFAPNHAYFKAAPREVFHNHNAEGSSHAILSAADASTVVERGWGERHGLAGSRIMGVPIQYVMVYAPRNEKEVEVVVGIAKAAARYALEGKILV
ncbi:hypothetical protein MMC14_005140 [Varicellaria rhodocarpa]|nr:hypothetical protein [Varicellaria rhodocarpa]